MGTHRGTIETTAIAVFARAPVAGAAKTRLIPRLGAEGAAELHAALVRKTLQTAVAGSLGSVTLWCSPDINHAFFATMQREFGVELHPQADGDLGERMLSAFRAYEPDPLLLIGTDCPVMTPEHLRQAAEDLIEGADAVFLPAEDGGYALVGLRRPIPSIFRDMLWGTNVVMAETRRRLSRLGASWTEPATVWDIDRPEDLDRLSCGCLLTESGER
jgi:rSAM/selenodomain-associated transferase 1